MNLQGSVVGAALLAFVKMASVAHAFSHYPKDDDGGRRRNLQLEGFSRFPGDDAADERDRALLEEERKKGPLELSSTSENYRRPSNRRLRSAASANDNRNSGHNQPHHHPDEDLPLVDDGYEDYLDDVGLYDDDYTFDDDDYGIKGGMGKSGSNKGAGGGKGPSGKGVGTTAGGSQGGGKALPPTMPVASCPKIPIFFYSNELVAAYQGTATGGTFQGVPFYSNENGEQLGWYSSSFTTLDAIEDCIGRSSYSFSGGDSSEDATTQLSISYRCAAGTTNAITGGTGDFGCATGFEERDFETDTVLATSLYICGTLCPKPTGTEPLAQYHGYYQGPVR